MSTLVFSISHQRAFSTFSHSLYDLYLTKIDNLNMYKVLSLHVYVQTFAHCTFVLREAQSVLILLERSVTSYTPFPTEASIMFFFSTNT